MNEDFLPLPLAAPSLLTRRKEKPRVPPIPDEVIARRVEIARGLVNQVQPLSKELHQMNEDERRAMFYKLEHEIPIQLTGTDLKPISEPTENITLAVPTSDSLSRLINKIKEFGKSEVTKGHVKNENIGAYLKLIEKGKPTDRLSDVLFDSYYKLINQDWVVCEIEMISLANGINKQRDELLEIRETLDVLFASGINGNFFEHEEIKGTCRAVIRCTGKTFKTLVENPEWQRPISWFDAKPEFETFHSTLKNFSVSSLGEFTPPNEKAPTICIIDSGVTEGNPFIEITCRNELCKSFLSENPDNYSDEYGHGSGVASLASYYALNLQNGANNVAKIWVANARVLNSNNEFDEDRLFSSVIKEVVEYFIPLGVRIFNLSVNILNRSWNSESKRTVPRRSWIARTIDKLSREYDIIFVISTGNLKIDEVKSYIANGKEYPLYLLDEYSRLLDPAQSALSLSVGALSPSTTIVGPSGSAMAIAEQNQPAPFTRSGPGINKEIKPELVEFGGNYIMDSENIRVWANPGTDVMMASHMLSPAITHESGTSYSAPRVAHKLALILKDLEDITDDKISSPLLKSFIINSSSTDSLGNNLHQIINQLNDYARNQSYNIVGYGLPDPINATYCDNYSVILFYQGEIVPNTVAFFEVPVPESLAYALTGPKRLIVTVTHAPEVQRWGLEKYLGTSLKWRLFRGDIDKEDIINAMSVEDIDQESTSGSLPNELSGKIGLTLRSRGTTQHDVFEWNRHQASYSASYYTLAIAAYEKWHRSSPPSVPYAVVIRLVDTTRSAAIYTEVKTQIDEIQIQSSTRI